MNVNVGVLTKQTNLKSQGPDNASAKGSNQPLNSNRSRRPINQATGYYQQTDPRLNVKKYESDTDMLRSHSHRESKVECFGDYYDQHK